MGGIFVGYQRKKWIIVLALIVVLCVWVAPASASGKQSAAKNAETYEQAQQMLEDGTLFDALDSFKKLQKYEDSALYAQYVQARILVLQGNFKSALEAYIKLGDFLDSRHNVTQLMDMCLLPVVNVGEHPYSKTPYKFLPKETDPASELLAAYDNPESFHYGLMNYSGKQVTPMEWPYIVGVTCLADVTIQTEGRSVGGSVLCLEHANGVIGPRHVTAYLVYDGTMSEYEYELPRPAEGDPGWGLIDAHGRVLVEPKYGRLLWMADGMAAFPIDTEANAVALFDLSQGTAPHQPVGVWDEALSPLEGDAPLYAVRDGNEWYYVGRDGQAAEGKFDEARPMQHGFGAVRKGELWGYMDADGQLAVECTFDEAGDFWQGIAPVRQGETWHFIDPAGKRAFAGDFNDADEFRDGLAPVRLGEYWGYVNTEGKMVLEAIYQGAGRFQLLVHLASAKADGKWGLIDKTGKWVAKPQFDGMLTFGPERVALMYDGYTEFGDESYVNNLYLARLLNPGAEFSRDEIERMYPPGFRNTYNDILNTIRQLDLGEFDQAAYDELYEAAVQEWHDNPANQRSGLIDYKGKIMAPAGKYSFFGATCHAYVYRDPAKGQWGLMSPAGKSLFTYDLQRSRFASNPFFRWTLLDYASGVTALRFHFQEDEFGRMSGRYDDDSVTETGFAVEYFDAKGKRVALTFDPELTPTRQPKGAPVPRPVSEGLPLKKASVNMLVDISMGLGSVPLYPFCPEYTIGDLLDGKLPEPWGKRLSLTQYEISWPKSGGMRQEVVKNNGNLLVINDSQSGIEIALDNAVYDADGQTVIGYQRREFFHGNAVGRSGGILFEEMQGDYHAYYVLENSGEDRPILTHGSPEEFYASLISTLQTIDGSEDIIAVLQRTAGELAAKEAEEQGDGPWFYRIYDDEDNFVGDKSLLFSVTDVFRIAQEPTGTWRDIGMFPLAYATLGQLVEPTPSDAQSAWYSRMDFNPDNEYQEWKDGEPQYTFMGTQARNGAYIILNDPIQDAEGRLAGYAKMSIGVRNDGIHNHFTIMGYHYDQDPNYADEPAARLDGQALYIINSEAVSETDFYNALWNALLELPKGQDSDRETLLQTFNLYFPEE